MLTVSYLDAWEKRFACQHFNKDTSNAPAEIKDGITIILYSTGHIMKSQRMDTEKWTTTIMKWMNCLIPVD